VDKNNRDGALKEYSLHRNQHAYETGKSIETALHNVVTRTENATEHKDIILGAFLYTEEAFDRISFNTIKQVAGRHGTEPAVCRWICTMLESRNISAILSGETVGAIAPEGVQREVCCRLCCGAWSWTIFFRDLTIITITQ
jgi:hypothetical protein